MGWAAFKVLLGGLPWKNIGIALAAIALVVLVWRAPWAEHRQSAKDAVSYGKKIDAISRDRDTWKADAVTLVAGLDKANKSIDDLKVQGDANKKASADNLSAQRKIDKGLHDQVTNLTRSGGLKYDKGAPCVVSDTLASIGKI